MTSSQIRQSFLDFFKSKQHTIVPSSSLMPDSPNLLFTNAGMNQFVPIFLGQQKCPYTPPRAADTQKCIRAGGKHNDLEDVGLDTYHHTFFEMLGNWSFGDYFKKEAIEWAWELVTGIWKFPKERLYATVFCPHMDMTRWEDELEGAIHSAETILEGGVSQYSYPPNEKATERSDEEAASFWAYRFLKAGIDPRTHIVPGNKKDNFWMMGETGPCGPCSELHVDLTPAGDTKGSLVNKGDARCIEIWNLVFIQFNANQDGTFSPLPARHVDTGMGFERVTSIIQGTKGFGDFKNAKISNYETDIFRPIFTKLEQLSGKRYMSTLPKPGSTGDTEQEKIDVACRVIADHIRTLSFAIADGIQPGNTDRNYVLRRILRRAVRYGRTLGFHEPFFYKLAGVLAETMGDVFPNIREKQKQVEEVLRFEEEAFNKTLDKGIQEFNDMIEALERDVPKVAPLGGYVIMPKRFAFTLYDTYGFPIDLTELMARERGFTVDVAGFNELMEEQRERARKAQKKEVISVSEIDTKQPTRFEGFANRTLAHARVLEVLSLKDKTAVILDRTPFYAEMGGQVGDNGELRMPNLSWHVTGTQKSGDVWLHLMAEESTPAIGTFVDAVVNGARRAAIERHHTVTHLLHWALHEVVSKDATQKGSYVGPEKLTFDFNHAPLTPQQVADVEKLVNERIVENASVSWTELPYAEVKPRKDILQFFGEKYGDTVRVVQIGGQPKALNGYSMELCGGTHTRATGEIGLFRIVGENAIAAGVRRIEAVAGLEAYNLANQQLQLIRGIAGKVNSPVHELEKKIEALLAQQKELEKQLKSVQQKQAAETARGLVAKAQTVGSTRAIIENLGPADGDYLQSIADSLKGQFKGVVVLGGVANNAVSLIASVSPDFTSKVQAGKIIQTIAPIVGGKGGGKPDNARGGGKDASKLDEALAKARELMA
jgi:alanyl-tRNA synthetase